MAITTAALGPSLTCASDAAGESATKRDSVPTPTLAAIPDNMRDVARQMRLGLSRPLYGSLHISSGPDRQACDVAHRQWGCM